MAINFVPFDATKSPTETNRPGAVNRGPKSVEKADKVKPADNDSNQPRKGQQNESSIDDEVESERSLEQDKGIDDGRYEKSSSHRIDIKV